MAGQRARYYDAGLGRFLGRDPITTHGRAFNAYEYDSSELDPTGMFGSRVRWAGKEAAIVSFIRQFDGTSGELFLEISDTARMFGHDLTLEPGDVFRVMGLLSLLADSANPEPNGSYSNWSTLFRSREYRAFNSVEMEIECNEEDKITKTDHNVMTDPGWTPISRPMIYHRGERGLTVSTVSFADEIDSTLRYGTSTPRRPGGTFRCLRVLSYQSTRIGHVGNIVNRLGFGVDAPFIWSSIDYRMCCNGASVERQVTFHGSHFPTHWAYVGGVHQGIESRQSGLGTFIFATPGAAANGGQFGAAQPMVEVN